MPFSRRLAVATAAALFLACAATAAPAPVPALKPGLWLLRMQPDDPAVAARLRELQARLKDAPPQLRQLAESMLQQQGAALAGNDSLRLCLGAGDLAGGGWTGAPRGGACTTTLTPGGAGGGTRFHTHCSAPVPSDTEGEARFLDPEHYTLSTTTTVATGSGTRTVRMSGQASWVSAGCGELGR